MREAPVHGMLAADVENSQEWRPVDLWLQVSRSADNRLSGTVRRDGAGDVRDFSGTLELMRVFEELVPVAPDRQ